MQRTPKERKVGSPSPSERTRMANELTEAGSLRTCSYRERQHARNSVSHAAVLGNWRNRARFIPTWIMRPRLGRILQEAP
jgi:hypothetical protein